MALVTAICAIGLNVAFTSLLRLTPPFLISIAVAAYVGFAIVLTRPITQRGEQDALVWSAMIVVLSLLMLFFYAD